MLRDNIYIHPPSFLFLCLWECDISIEGRRPGHRTEYSAHVFNVKTSPAGSCSIFPQSTWALCPKRWDFLCIQVTGWVSYFFIFEQSNPGIRARVGCRTPSLATRCGRSWSRERRTRKISGGAQSWLSMWEILLRRNNDFERILQRQDELSQQVDWDLAH